MKWAWSPKKDQFVAKRVRVVRGIRYNVVSMSYHNSFALEHNLVYVGYIRILVQTKITLRSFSLLWLSTLFHISNIVKKKKKEQKRKKSNNTENVTTENIVLFHNKYLR
jgi:hypothetical protein